MKLEALLKRREALKKALTENAQAIEKAQRSETLQALKKSGLLSASPEYLAEILERAKTLMPPAPTATPPAAPEEPTQV